MKLLSLLKSWFIEYLTPSPRYPSHARMQQLHDGEGEPITRAEWNLGAHYCPEFDYMFTFGERPEGGCYCRSSIGEYQSTHTDHCLATHPANYEPCEHEFEPEPHGTRDTFVPHPTDKELDQMQSVRETREAKLDEAYKSWDPYPTKCDDQLIAEMQTAIDSITEEDMKPIDSPVPPIPSPQDKTIHYHNKRWWFWDETGQHRHGPYETHAECLKDFDHYCNVYLGEPEVPEESPVIKTWKKELKEGGLDTTPTDF